MMILKLFTTLFLVFTLGAACSHSPKMEIGGNPNKGAQKIKINSVALAASKFSKSLLGKRKITYPLMTKKAEINIWENVVSPHGPTPNSFPIIEIKSSEKRELVVLKDFPNFSITHVFQDLPGGKILILLDYAVEGPLEEYTRIASEDEGLTWKKISPLPKNPSTFPFGELLSLWGNSKGEWTAYFSQDNKVFKSQSNDGGESWQPENAPVYENEWTLLPPNS